MNLKKALKHDVEVAGKTIPTMILVGLFLVGGSSAAILSSFGTVSGEANVDQAVTFKDSSDPITVGFGTDGAFAGQTYVEEATLESQTEVPATVSFETTLSDGDQDESFNTDNFDVGSFTQTTTDITWASDSNGDAEFYTKVVERYEAGHSDFASYSGVPEDYSDVTTISSESEVPDNFDADTVYKFEELGDGSSYEGFTVEADGVEIYAATQGVDIEGTVNLHADDLVFQGFHVEVTGDSNGVDVGPSTAGANVEVAYNYVESTDGPDNSDRGVNLESGADNANVSYNKIEGFKTGTQGQTPNTDIKYNTFVDNYAGVGSTTEGSVEIKYNVFDSNNEGIGLGSGIGLAVESNNFEANTASMRVYHGSDQDLGNNYFADGKNFEVAEGSDGSVDSAYETFPEQVTLNPGKEEDFAVVYNFPINLEPDSYSFTTEVIPVTE